MAVNRKLHALLCATLGAGVVGCASTQLDAQWSDPQLAPNPLRGARVMVVCEAYDLAVKRICQDQMAAEVVARGGTAVPGPEASEGAPVRPLNNDQYLGAARTAGAKAVLTHSITTADVSTGSGVSIGIGAFGIGGGSVRGGAGVSVPVGGQRTNTGYAINSRVTEVASGKLLWTAKASAAPSSDVSAQLSELHKVVFGAADKANLF
ncbi:MAG: hypothetical protein KIT60_15360 [Burkholderiaceae bacterium]|nr:hypothetical protein [Burkholderiaceae bacterium]